MTIVARLPMSSFRHLYEWQLENFDQIHSSLSPDKKHRFSKEKLQRLIEMVTNPNLSESEKRKRLEEESENWF